MRVEVISEFYDKFHTSRLFKVGEVLDFAEERVNDLLARGLVKTTEQEKVETPEVETNTEAEAPKQEEEAKEEEVTETQTEADAKAQSEAKAKEAIAKARKAVKSSKK